MFAVLFAVLCLMCLSTTMADQHKSCHTPNMTGYLTGVNYKGGSVLTWAFSYDSLAKRLHMKSVQTPGLTPIISNKAQDVLMLFDEGFFYEINRTDQSCEKKVLHSAVSSMDVPPNATFLLKTTIGSGSVPGEGLTVSVWVGSIPETNDTPNMTGYLTGVNYKGGSVLTWAFSYDSLAKRLHMKSVQTPGLTPIISNKAQDVLMLFDEGFFYEINRTDQSCEKKVLHSAVSSMDVPPNATFLLKTTIGSGSVPGEGLTVSVWVGSIPETNATSSTSLTMGCIPVIVTYHNPTTIASVSHVEVETGIKDPEKLEVPSFCEGKAVEETPDGTVHTFFTLIL
ncbi:hypothetical protein CRUP_017607 [Coryphaenoides rupestris]|nr:hypothetical protein CRUP_017607 [Coryphaenoides rupestris]